MAAQFSPISTTEIVDFHGRSGLAVSATPAGARWVVATCSHPADALVILALLACMVLGGGFVGGVGTHHDLTRGPGGPVTAFTMIGYVVGSIALFILAGAGKAAVYKLIPSLSEARSRGLEISNAERHDWARVRLGALIGFAGAFGALGSVGINLALRQSHDSTCTETPAFWIFVAC